MRNHPTPGNRTRQSVNNDTIPSNVFDVAAFILLVVLFTHPGGRGVPSASMSAP